MKNYKSEQVMTLQVTEGLSVAIIQDKAHEFLMTTKDVAKGYDVSPNTLRTHFHRNKDEFLEGIHFIKGVSILNTPAHNFDYQPHTTFWTKKGIIRLGFFIKSERAKLFRNWIEEIVINVLDRKIPKLPATPKRKHNRLTSDRILDIMADIVKIDDKELRLSLTNKILGGQNND